MSEIPSDIVYKKLVLVRQIFLRSLDQLHSANNYADKIMALIGFDLANETAMKVYLHEHASKNPKKDRNFHECIEDTKKSFSDRSLDIFPNELSIRKVHTHRNMAQHEGDAPGDETLSDARTYTQDFLLQFFEIAWKLDFRKITQINLIKNDRIRELFTKSRDALDAGQYDDSLIACIAGFNLMTSWIANAIAPSRPFGARFSYGDETSVHLIDLKSQIDVLKSLQINSLLRIDLRSYSRYREIIAGVNVNWLGNDDADLTATLMRGEITSDETIFALQFATETVVSVEFIAGDLGNPFGITDANRHIVS